MVNEPGGPQPAHGERVAALSPKWTRMRFVRCDACGAKALVAASQCPQCAHVLALRDSRGEPFRLAYCASCDSFYPRQRGGCKWCGTTAPAIEIARYVWGGLGAVVVVVLGVTGWRLRDRVRDETPAQAAYRAMAAESSMVRLRPDSGIATTVIQGERADTALRDTTVRETAAGEPATPLAAARDTMTSVSTQPISSPTVTAPSVGTAIAPAPIPSPLVAAAPVRPARIADPPPRSALTRATPIELPGHAKHPGPASSADVAIPRASSRVAPTAPSRVAPPKSARNARWVPATVRGWVNVRADASRDARVVASIGPDTRVQLGESRAGWVRLRARGISGWVDGSRFVVDSDIRR